MQAKRAIMEGLEILNILSIATAPGWLQHFDRAVRAGVHAHASPAWTTFFRAVTVLGSPAVVYGVAVLGGAALAWYGAKRAGLWLALTNTLAGLAMEVLKHTVRRVRPPEAWFGYAMPHSFSFPSGHAVSAVCLYGTLALLLSRRIASMPARLGLWCGVVGIAVAIGLSRVYFGVHYPSDVLAGLLLGAVFLLAAWIALPDCVPGKGRNR